MYKLLIGALLISCVACFTGDDFDLWSKQYGKRYNNEGERAERMNIWFHNIKYIHKTNRLGLPYKLGINEYADITWEEFKTLKLGYAREISIPYKYTLDKIYPESINWTAKGVVTPVKNQYSCGSCWAFSTTGAVESAYAIATGNLISLSEENLIDCSFKYGNAGCNGGLQTAAMKYVIDNEGIDTEKSYPLTSVFFGQCTSQKNCPCEFKRDHVGAKVSSYKSILVGNETDLQYAIKNIGPVSISIDVTKDFQFYTGGVYIASDCSTTNLNHAVLAAGFGELNGIPYYIVKNSWGAAWGLDGYILMARGRNNMCGVATDALYAII